MLQKDNFLKIAGRNCRESKKSLEVTRHETPNSSSLQQVFLNLKLIPGSNHCYNENIRKNSVECRYIH